MRHGTSNVFHVVLVEYAENVIENLQQLERRLQGRNGPAVVAHRHAPSVLSPKRRGGAGGAKAYAVVECDESEPFAEGRLIQTVDDFLDAIVAGHRDVSC